MWSFLGLGRTTVTCWFCNEKTKLPRAENDHDTKQSWHCEKCNSQNILDENGSIVDSFEEMFRESPLPNTRSPAAPASSELRYSPNVFCDTCQRNQELVRQILSEYLPDEDENEYAFRVGRLDEYEQSVRRRYPVVCRSCQSKVDERLQRQAQWMCRKELASALKRSDSARKFAPHIQPQPTLRRKHKLAAWLLCAIIGLFLCPLAMWAWYYCVYCEILRSDVLVLTSGALLSAITYLSSMVNPLWLHIARNPGRRAHGLALYRLRVGYLSSLRLVAALLQACTGRSVLAPVVCACDVAFCFLAVRPLHVSKGKKPRPSLNSRSEPAQLGLGIQQGQKEHQGGADTTTPASVARDANLALASLQNLTFSTSEANLDQDDSYRDTPFSSALNSRWIERPTLSKRSKRHFRSSDESSGDEYSDIEPLPDLDVLSMGTRSRKGSVRQDVEKMDVDLASALSGNSRPKPSAADAGKAIDYRPFQTARFSAAPSTGLEAKMTSFSIDDDDDDSIIGSHGFLSSPAADRSLPHLIQSTGPLNVILTAGVICTWLVAERIPTWLFWLLRFVLIAKLVCKAAHLAAQKKAHTPRAARATRPVSTGKGSLQPWVLVCTAVLVCLAAAPGIYTLGLVPAAAASSHSQGWSLLRWPLARRAMSHAILNTDLGDTTVEAAASALLGLDLAAELASLFV